MVADGRPARRGIAQHSTSGRASVGDVRAVGDDGVGRVVVVGVGRVVVVDVGVERVGDDTTVSYAKTVWNARDIIHARVVGVGSRRRVDDARVGGVERVDDGVECVGVECVGVERVGACGGSGSPASGVGMGRGATRDDAGGSRRSARRTTDDDARSVGV